MTDCQRKTILGRPACRFEGRYDKRDLPIFEPSGANGMVIMSGFDRKSTTYIRDVCTRCGKTIERQSKESV